MAHQSICTASPSSAQGAAAQPFFHQKIQRYHVIKRIVVHWPNPWLLAEAFCDAQPHPLTWCRGFYEVVDGDERLVVDEIIRARLWRFLARAVLRRHGPSAVRPLYPNRHIVNEVLSALKAIALDE